MPFDGAGLDPERDDALLIGKDINFSLYPVNRWAGFEIQRKSACFGQFSHSRAVFSTKLLRIMCERHCARPIDLLDHVALAGKRRVQRAL